MKAATTYLVPLVAFLATAFLIVLLRPIAASIGLVDEPNERKSHGAPTPLVGGLAVFVSLATSCLVWLAWGELDVDPRLSSFFAAGLLLVAVGVVDDFLELAPAARFIAQIAASLLMIFGAGVVLTDLGSITFGGELLPLGILAVPFTIFATLGVINAMNMCDGLDGLSGSLSLVSLMGLAIAAYLWGADTAPGVLPVLGACIVGFLLFNLRLPGRARASVFLGDAGSMFLGFALTWYAISLSQGEDRVISPASALWFLMLPIFDAVSMMLRRLLKGRSPFSPDREHLHHVFLLAGYSVNQTVAIMATLAVVGVLTGLAANHWAIPDLLVAGTFLAVGLGYLWLIMHAWRMMRFLHRSMCRRRTGDRRSGVLVAYAGPERRRGNDRRQAVPSRSAGYSAASQH